MLKAAEQAQIHGAEDSSSDSNDGDENDEAETNKKPEDEIEGMFEKEWEWLALPLHLLHQI